MKTSIRGLLVAIAVITLVASGLALAQGTQGTQPQNQTGRPMMQGRGGMMQGFGPMMLGRLNLTDQQRSQVQALQQQHRAANQELMQKMADLQRQLRDAIFADNGPDETRANQLQQQIAQLDPQLREARLQMEVAVAKILTPEQRKQVRDTQFRRSGRGLGRGRGWM